MLGAPVNLRGQSWIARLDGQEHGNLLTVAVMAILLDPKDLEHPTGGAVAPFKHHPELINVDELASGDLKDPKRR
jgi:hypothetical protein